MLSGKQFLSKEHTPLILNSVLVLSGLLLLTFLIFTPYIPYSIKLHVGDVANRTLVSPRYLTFTSSNDAEKNRVTQSEITKSVGKIYSINPAINETIHLQVSQSFDALEAYRLDFSANRKLEAPDSLTFIPPLLLKKVVQTSGFPLNKMRQFSLLVTDKVLANGIQEINRSAIEVQIDEIVLALGIGITERNLIKTVVFEFIQPNLVFDKDKTLGAIQEAFKSIPKYTSTFKEGQPILYKGDTVSPYHIEVLKALNIYEVKMNRIKILGIFLICFFNFLLLERFIYYFRHKLHHQVKYYILILSITVTVLLLARTLQFVDLGPSLFNFKFLVPISIAGMVISLLITPNFSLLCGTMIALMACVMYRGDFTLFLFLFFSNAVTAFATFNCDKRSEFIRAGYVVGGFNILFVITIGLFQEVQSLGWYGANVVLGFANGLISSMLTLAILPYFESIFKITTTQKLLELSNLNHPLLKKLMINAPGTYQHSLMVANLAERAAQALKADVVLCRVGSYFHDVGKIKRPIFFSENQFSVDNPHDTLSPRISRMIIAAHTKDGVELATKYKLPQVLKDIMLQHHGTSLVSFFYSQVVHTEELNGEEEETKELFRYTGPKPNFVESGIVMLADSVEAAVRSLEKPTPQKIENLVDKIFKDKLDDGQLDDCPLSLRDINAIKQTFLKVFKGVHHHRVDYEDEIQTIISAQKNTKKNDKD